MKVAVTTAKIECLYNNGVRFNTIIWYDFFENCGFDTTFITNEECQYLNYKFLNYSVMMDDKQEPIENYKEKHPELFDFDIVFTVGAYSQPYFDLIKKHNIKLIFVMLGSVYHNDVHCITDKGFSNEKHTFDFDEIWASPHFKYCLEYYKIRYNTDKVFIGPYFWRDDLFKQENTFNKVLTNTQELNIAIVEPNIEQAKNCLIPIAICERARKYINQVKVFNAAHIQEYSRFFKSYVLSTELYKSGKMSVEHRHPLPIILTVYCNCVVSFVEDCDLNYVFLECFYLGVPLVHNSLMLKDYGYYYPKLSVSKGAEQIAYLVQHHNRNAYIEKHASLLKKYSVTNPVYITWVKERVKNNVDFNCDDI